MRNFLLSLIVISGAATAAASVQAAPRQALAVEAPPVQLVQYYGGGYGGGYGNGYGGGYGRAREWRHEEWRRREAYEHWRRHQEWRQWRHAREW